MFFSYSFCFFGFLLFYVSSVYSSGSFCIFFILWIFGFFFGVSPASFPWFFGFLFLFSSASSLVLRFLLLLLLLFQFFGFFLFSSGSSLGLRLEFSCFLFGDFFPIWQMPSCIANAVLFGRCFLIWQLQDYFRATVLWKPARLKILRAVTTENFLKIFSLHLGQLTMQLFADYSLPHWLLSVSRRPLASVGDQIEALTW